MYKRSPPPESEWGFLADIAKIALGVFIGIMAANFAEEAITKWRIEQAARQAMQELRALEDQQRLAAQAKLQQQQEKQAQLRTLEAQRELQRQQQRLATQRKEQAWTRFYQPSTTCRVDPSRGDCADAHIRARKAFEAQYRD